MATLKTETGSVDVADGERLLEAGETLDVPFGCTEGFCGTCFLTVLEGKENLSELTQEERDQDCDGDTRLCCQMRIKSGEVKIKV